MRIVFEGIFVLIGLPAIPRYYQTQYDNLFMNNWIASMASPELEDIWKNPSNWSGLYYKCADDPRLSVPKRRGIGWTINFGHPHGKLALVSLVLLGLVPPGYVILTEGPAINPAHIMVAIAISCAISIAFCLWGSRAQMKKSGH